MTAENLTEAARLTDAAREYRYHEQRLTELASDVEALASGAADLALALLATAHTIGDGRTVDDAARLLGSMDVAVGVPWSADTVARITADARVLEGRREALAGLLDAHRIAGERCITNGLAMYPVCDTLGLRWRVGR